MYLVHKSEHKVVNVMEELLVFDLNCGATRAEVDHFIKSAPIFVFGVEMCALTAYKWENIL